MTHSVMARCGDIVNRRLGARNRFVAPATSVNDVAKVAGKPQRSLLFLSTVLCLALLALTGCGSGMSDDDKEIAIAVALTQTAAAVEPTLAATPTAASSSDATSAEATGAETGAEEPTATAAPAEPTATPLPAEPTATTAEVAAADGAPTATPLTAAGLPVTQNRLKVRTLLVAPGEPGALYALLTDQVDDRAPATNAQFLTSLDFGVTWQAAPSGLPVAEDCLYNINMDYYDATALYASTCQGIYRWSKASGAWSAVADQETRMVAVVYGNANLIWATRPVTDTAAAPVILSQNGGQSWQEIPMAHTKGVAALNISPRDSQSGYALVWPGGDGSYLRRGTFIQEWQIMPAPNDNAAPLNPGMTIDGGTGWLYVTTAEVDGDRLWLSSDPDTPAIEDVSWQAIHRFAPDMTVTLLASGWSSEADKLAIYANIATSGNGQPRFTLVRSLDNGETWQPLVIDAG